jgi:hypothetical protein
MQVSVHFDVFTYQLNMNRYARCATEKKCHSSCGHRILVFWPDGSHIIQLFSFVHGNKKTNSMDSFCTLLYGAMGRIYNTASNGTVGGRKRSLLNRDPEVQ